jgi:hypothetical protein
MTPEDIAQITAIVAASEQRTGASITAAIAASEQRIIAAVDQRMTERLDRAVEALTANLSEVRQELSIRLDTLNRRFEAQAPTIVAIDQRVSALVRQYDRLERDNGAMLSNDAAQQRAFDALAARVARIEREIHPEQH